MMHRLFWWMVAFLVYVVAVRNITGEDWQPWQLLSVIAAFAIAAIVTSRRQSRR
jgi:ABC-type Co2+ transport system permease subunit